MPVPAAVKRIYDQGVARRPAPVHSGLVDTRPACDGLHAEAVVSLFAKLDKRGMHDGVPYPGAPATQSRIALCRHARTHNQHLIASQVTFTTPVGNSSPIANNVASEG